MSLRLNILLVAAALLVAACAQFQSGSAIKDVKLSDKAVVLTVPVVLQDDQYDCGVAALSMILAYYGKPRTPEKSVPLRAKAVQDQGLKGADLEAYMVAEGFDTALFAGELSGTVRGLYYHLDRGRPLVVAMNVLGDANHFVLVTGYDPENDWLLLQDPVRGALVITSGQFDHAWKRARNFTLLATPGQ